MPKSKLACSFLWKYPQRKYWKRSTQVRMKHSFLPYLSCCICPRQSRKICGILLLFLSKPQPSPSPPQLASYICTSAVGSRSMCGAHLRYRHPRKPAIRSSLWRVKGLPPAWWWVPGGIYVNLAQPQISWGLELSRWQCEAISMQPKPWASHQASHHLPVMHIAEAVPPPYMLSICASHEISLQNSVFVNPNIIDTWTEDKEQQDHQTCITHASTFHPMDPDNQGSQESMWLTKRRRWRRDSKREVREWNCSSVCPKV